MLIARIPKGAPMSSTVANPPPGAGPDPVEPGAPGPDGDDGVEVPPRRRTGVIVSAVVAVVLLAFVAVLATSDPATERRSKSPLVGRTVPALAGETLAGGTFDIDDQRGRWVVVNFFATWCLPCRQEHPELRAFDEEHRTTGDAAVVSVPYRDDDDKIRDYFAANGGEWPVLVNDEGRAATTFGVVKVPETYLVDPTGRVVAKFVGGVTRAGLDAEILRHERGAP
jgi:cytochrome c biogenesis protein CcmG/thiol:disulfide interchange protein DsbE